MLVKKVRLGAVVVATDGVSSVEYRDVQGFPGYRVGSDGSVWSCWQVYYSTGRRGCLSRMADHWHRLKPLAAYGGYRAVHFRRGNRAYRRVIHTVVLVAFVGERPAGMQACHGDGNRVNNRLDNLRWGTPVENAADRDRHGTTAWGTRNGNAKLTEADVVELRRMRAEGGNVRAAASRFGVHPEHAFRVAKGKSRKSHTAKEAS